MKDIFDKDQFLLFWGDAGYLEDFSGYRLFNENFDTLYEKMIKPFENTQETCLEIGCGRGLWMNRMVDKFKVSYAIDVIPRPSELDRRVKFIELDSFDYKCTGIKDDSVDFVFSFGVFCHLPNSANYEYVKNIMRVLKPGGSATIMFADWNTHNNLKKVAERGLYREISYKELGWFFMDYDTIADILNKNGVTNFRDLIPSFRDRIIHFKKDNNE